MFQVGLAEVHADDLRGVAHLLRDDAKGVVDEVGALVLHRLYADRFFPGTSVQHTRLRYVLFLGWVFRDLAREAVPRARLLGALSSAEARLARRLAQPPHAGKGIIGGTKEGAVAQPPSLTYWNALRTWHILRRVDHRPDRPTRADFLARWPVRWTRGADDDGHALEQVPSLLEALPEPPEHWHRRSESLTFELTPSEASDLRRRLAETPRFGRHGQPRSLLAHLAEHPTTWTAETSLFDPEVIAVADAAGERGPLDRARRVAAFSHVLRAAYAAALEHSVDLPDRRFRRVLERVLDAQGELAGSVDFDEVLQDGVDPHTQQTQHGSSAALRPGTMLRGRLDAVRDWIRTGSHALCEVVVPLRALERARKPGRARLALGPAGEARRASWNPRKHPAPAPVHYRWHVARDHLRDLQGRR